MRAAALSFAALGAALAAFPAAKAGAPESRVLIAGPTLAGSGVAWVERDAAGEAVRLWSRRRGAVVVYRAASEESIGEVDGSSRVLALWRAYPGCPQSGTTICPQVNDGLAGPPGGPLRPIEPPRTCFLPWLDRHLDVDGGLVAYARLDCDRNGLALVVRDLQRGGSPQVLREMALSYGCCTGVRVAGRFAAWGEQHDTKVVLYDRIARRMVAVARTGSPVRDLDVERDGKAALVYGSGATMRLAWFGPGAPGLHVLAVRGSLARVRIAGGRIVFQRGTELLVADLPGRARTIARLGRPVADFGFDGERLTWASTKITSKRIDCPPPGRGRPCVQRFTGVTTIRLARAPDFRSQPVAALPFADVVLG